MPWVAVHTTINGPKLRKLRKKLKIRSREAKGLLLDLWHWGLENANRDGYIIDAEREDIEEFDNDYDDEREYTPRDAVDALIETGWIDEIDGKFFIHDWDVWQEFWYKAKERRVKDTERKRESRRMKKEQEVPALPPAKEDEKSKDIPTEETQDAPTGKLKKQKVEYAKDFEEFWDEYPRRVDKGNAYKKYKARLNDGYSPEELLLAAQNYAMQCKRQRTEEKYIKHATTFLSDSTPFLDFLPKKTILEEKSATFDGNPFQQYGGDDE